MKEIYYALCWFVSIVASLATGLILALTVCKMIPVHYSVIGLIITLGLLISSMVVYWKKSKKDDTP